VELLKAADGVTGAEYYSRADSKPNFSDETDDEGYGRGVDKNSALIVEESDQDSEYQEDDTNSEDDATGSGCASVTAQGIPSGLEAHSKDDGSSLPEDFTPSSSTSGNSHEAGDHQDDLDHDNGLHMMLLQLEKSTAFPVATKRRLFKLQMRNIRDVLEELSSLIGPQPAPWVSGTAQAR